MPERPIALRRARVDDLGLIVFLIEEAAEWLRGKGTDQWATPWPNRAGRDSRILASLSQDKTWIGWDDSVPAVTITADPAADPYWPDDLRREPAVYVHRLIVRRPYSGAGLGAALLNWAGWTGRRDHGAQWIRVSAWTTNTGLHEYYRRQGFAACGFHPDDGYPSRARFQKPTEPIPPDGPGLLRGLFRESWPPGPHE